LGAPSNGVGSPKCPFGAGAVGMCRTGKDLVDQPRWSGLNKQIKRRTDGVFPNPTALLRLAGSVLVEAYDEWQVADKRLGSAQVSRSPCRPERSPTPAS
jgi:Transposase, Mutator family